MLEYVATTEKVTVKVRPLYLEEQSDFFTKKFVFAYFIRVENDGAEPVQLLRRHWFIKHGTGRVEEVEGEGVVGKQPVILPGGFHEYNSFCVLEALEGSMEGTYLMQRHNGEFFRAEIPRFALRVGAN